MKKVVKLAKGVKRKKEAAGQQSWKVVNAKKLSETGKKEKLLDAYIWMKSSWKMFSKWW